jgi:hypothetical protein
MVGGYEMKHLEVEGRGVDQSLAKRGVHYEIQRHTKTQYPCH